MPLEKNNNNNNNIPFKETTIELKSIFSTTMIKARRQIIFLMC